MTPADYLESIGYEVDETRGNLSVLLWEDDERGQLTESQLEAFAKERGWRGYTPHAPEGER